MYFKMPVGEALVYALLGYVVVFFGISLLMAVVMIMGKIFIAKDRKAAAAKAALGDLARCEEDVMSYICFPDQAKKYLEGVKAAEENKVTYTITEA